MPEEVMQVVQSSFNDMGITIIKYILIAGVCALPFVYINGKLKKKEQTAKDKKEETKIQRAIQKALDEDRKKR